MHCSVASGRNVCVLETGLSLVSFVHRALPHGSPSLFKVKTKE